MVAEADVPHTTKVSYPSEAEAIANIEVTPYIEVTPHADVEVPRTNDMEVSPPAETDAIASASTDPSAHTN